VLVIYKLEKGLWTEWQRSADALLGSRDGGMMGDPFGELEIVEGLLVISHNGGSSWKWNFTDIYRYQEGEFYLVHFSNLHGKPCEYWQSADFDLLTGMLMVEKEYEECENGDQEIYLIENENMMAPGLVITMKNRQEKEIKLVTPKYGHNVWVAAGRD
jgi:hypothetical protein